MSISYIRKKVESIYHKLFLFVLPSVRKISPMIVLVIFSFLIGVVIPIQLASSQERSSSVCNDERCYVDMVDWADPRDPGPPGGPYQPNNIIIRPGATVLWRNSGFDAHTVTSGLAPMADGIFDSQIIQPGEIFWYQFSSDGVIQYFCGIHPWMTGQVEVSGDPIIVVDEVVDEVVDDISLPTILTVMLEKEVVKANSDVLLTVEASDNDRIAGITADEIELTRIDGNESMGRWTGTLIAPQDEGKVEIILIVMDASGNHAETTLVYQVDNTPPSIVIMSPIDGEAISTPTIEIIGLIEDNVLVEEATLEGMQLIVDGNVFRSVLSLNIGINEFTISATDVAGNSNELLVEVIRSSSTPIPERLEEPIIDADPNIENVLDVNQRSEEIVQEDSTGPSSTRWAILPLIAGTAAIGLVAVILAMRRR